MPFINGDPVYSPAFMNDFDSSAEAYKIAIYKYLKTK